jgi:molecular chaperone DnaJ
MTERLDPYRVLGVPRDADATTIRNAFRKLAFRHHPDRNPDSREAEERFKAIAAAYEILTHPGLLERWRRGAEATRQRAGFPGGPFQYPFRGPARTRARSRPGEDVDLRIELASNEILEDREITLRYNVRRACERCGGRGGAGSMVPCPTCLGWGRVRPPPGRSFRRGAFAMDCPDCRGTAYVFLTPCTACGGDGLVTVEGEAVVRVPAGVRSGKVIRVPGAGHTGPRGGVRGRLRVRVDVASACPEPPSPTEPSPRRKP